MSPVDWRPAWERQQRELQREQRRAETDRAIVEERLPPNLETLMHWLNRGADEFGAVWKGAAALALDLGWSDTWVYVLLKRACELGVLHQVDQGGGCHRTSTYALKIGFWRLSERNPHMHRDWADRVRAIRATVQGWLADLFWTHHEQHGCGDRCWRFAPRELKQPPIDWAET